MNVLPQAFPSGTIGGPAGMTLLDWFAGQAMIALIAGNEETRRMEADGKTSSAPDNYDVIAEWAYDIAGLMMEAREMASNDPRTG